MQHTLNRTINIQQTGIVIQYFILILFWLTGSPDGLIVDPNEELTRLTEMNSTPKN